MDKPKKYIGTKYLTYAEKRNIALPFESYEVKRTIDIYVLLAAGYLRLKGKPNHQLVNLHNDLNFNDCIGFHLWNPSQNLNINESALTSRDFTQTLRFIFVGRDFFRKGGYECVKAFTEIVNQGFDAELIIVSQLTTYDYPNPAPKENLEHAIKLIKDSQDKIKLFNELNNQEVLALISKSHVGLLPTYNDSYGYSVLEFFSYGCPVITTSILALSEINHQDRGWLVDMPLVENEEGIKLIDRTSPDKVRRISNLLTESLIEILSSILTDRSQLSSKSIASLKYVKLNHSQVKNIKTLEQIYGNF